MTAPRVGENLVFDVFWMGIHVGEGRLEVREEVMIGKQRAYHVVATAKTNDFLSVIYPVLDQIHSFIDAEDFYSLEFRKTLREGRYRADEKIVYDAEKKKAFYESFHNGTRKEIDLPFRVHDLVSAFYWFRLQNIEVGKSARTVVNDEEKNWELEMPVLRRETKELRGQRSVDTILVELKTSLRGALVARSRAWVNFSADAKRTPVFIKLQTPYGPVVGVLRNVEGG